MDSGLPLIVLIICSCPTIILPSYETPRISDTPVAIVVIVLALNNSALLYINSRELQVQQLEYIVHLVLLLVPFDSSSDSTSVLTSHHGL